jgi:hypothetical protein
VDLKTTENKIFSPFCKMNRGQGDEVKQLAIKACGHLGKEIILETAYIPPHNSSDFGVVYYVPQQDYIVNINRV